MMIIKQFNLAVFALFLSVFVHAQMHSTKKQSNKETAPGTIKPEQKWWNLLYYKIDITPDYGRKYITGTNSITFTALQSDSILQIDLQNPMRITSVRWK